MRIKRLLILAISVVLTSCIKQEALHMEADIVSVEVPEALINGHPVIHNDQIVVYAKEGADLKDVPFKFGLSAGASARPASGTKQDFNKSVIYTVRSQDGRFEKKYIVSFLRYLVPLNFDFERFSLDKTYSFTSFYEENNGARQEIWASANSLYSLFITDPKVPNAYPMSYTEEAQTGKYALALETKSTGFLGAMFNKPIAAGNIFIGSFDAQIATIKPLEATHFGLPFNQIPDKLSGYYKYMPGKQMTNMASEPIAGEDEGDLYAVMFNKAEVTAGNPQVSWLDGSNVFTDPSIVAIARLVSVKKTGGSGFVYFEAPFKFKKPLTKGEVDANVYSMVIVASSSKKGDIFEGAVGSRMIVDNLKIEVK